MADLHSAAGNESPRCNCFGRPGTNPGFPVHGNHATRPAVRHQDGPAGPGAGEDTSGPGWDREWLRNLPHSLPSATYDEPDLAGRARRELDDLLADLDHAHQAWQSAQDLSWKHAIERDEMYAKLTETRADLDAAMVTIRALQDELATARRAAIGLSAGLESARRDGAADMLDRAAAKLQAYSDVHSSTVAMLRRWAAEVRAGPPTDRTAVCCDLHGSHCEPPSELCCWQCTEAAHPEHPTGVACVLPPTDRSST